MKTVAVISMAILCWAPGGGAAELPDVEDLPVIEDLPDPFMMNDGTRVVTRDDWAKRRVEIVEMLEYYEYGHMPPSPENVEKKEMVSVPVFGGIAELYKGAISLGPDHALSTRVSFYVPLGTPGPYPVVLSMAPVSEPKLRDVAKTYVERGFILAGFERHDFDGDNADRSDGVHPLYSDHDWATIAAWAWGAHRVLDYLLTRDDVDSEHIALTGHSRAGKTALFAAAMDERIALAAPNGSGAGGAGSYRILGDLEKDSESLDAITDPERFHYWFHPRLRTFVGKENRLPFDQHFLKAAIAPRALLCTEALSDFWANPYGTQQTTIAAQPVFDFLGVPDKNALHYREGGHAMSEEDWMALLDFADLQFFGKESARDFAQRPFEDGKQYFSWSAP